MYLFAVYSVILASANLLADRMEKRGRQVWIALAIWHFFNLLTLEDFDLKT